MPLHQACYVPAPVDKIFGAYGPYVVKFNATTGQREAQAIVRGPAEATCGICYHAATATLYVSVWNSMGNQYEFLAHTDVDIFPVNPVSLLVGAGLGWSTFYGGGGGARKDWPLGPRMLADFGTSNVYFIGADGHDDSLTWIGYINPAVPAVVTNALSGLDLWCEQISTDGTNVYFCEPWTPRVWKSDMVLNPVSYDSVGFVETGIVMPVGIEHSYVNNKQYVVCGNQWMARIDSWTPDTYTVLNLDVVNANSEPLRLRYRASDTKLYIPCQTTDGIIVWNPLTETGVWKSGFQSPIDVVFTGTKAFAVQNGPVSLKEIV